MSEIFDASYSRRDTVKRENHGKNWTIEELDYLRSLYDINCTLEQMCGYMQRPAAGILSKLGATGCVRYESSTNTYYRRLTPTSGFPQLAKFKIKPEIKEEIMSTKTIESITFIKGKNAEDLTDNEIFSEIGNLETQKAALNKIENKPKKLEAAIVALQADIQALVDYVDGR